MCIHTDDDNPCYDCCFQAGLNDARDLESNRPPYKNWDECNAYDDGYKAGMKENKNA